MVSNGVTAAIAAASALNTMQALGEFYERSCSHKITLSEMLNINFEPKTDFQLYLQLRTMFMMLIVHRALHLWKSISESACTKYSSIEFCRNHFYEEWSKYHPLAKQEDYLFNTKCQAIFYIIVRELQVTRWKIKKYVLFNTAVMMADHRRFYQSSGAPSRRMIIMESIYRTITGITIISRNRKTKEINVAEDPSSVADLHSSVSSPN